MQKKAVKDEQSNRKDIENKKQSGRHKSNDIVNTIKCDGIRQSNQKAEVVRLDLKNEF